MLSVAVTDYSGEASNRKLPNLLLDDHNPVKAGH